MVDLAQPKVLVIGVDPATLDPAEWGVTAEDNARVLAAIGESERLIREAGYGVEMCLLPLDADLTAALAPRLTAESWDVVVVGGGIRKPPELLELFEQVVNLVHRHAPRAAIAFNTTPADCLQATQRWVKLK